jgi:hypothetical protein
MHLFDGLSRDVFPRLPYSSGLRIQNQEAPVINRDCDTAFMPHVHNRDWLANNGIIRLWATRWIIHTIVISISGGYPSRSFCTNETMSSTGGHARLRDGTADIFSCPSHHRLSVSCGGLSSLLKLTL